jgi:hypothetical protein
VVKNKNTFDENSKKIKTYHGQCRKKLCDKTSRNYVPPQADVALLIKICHLKMGVAPTSLYHYTSING